MRRSVRFANDSKNVARRFVGRQHFSPCSEQFFCNHPTRAKFCLESWVYAEMFIERATFSIPLLFNAYGFNLVRAPKDAAFERKQRGVPPRLAYTRHKYLGKIF